MRLPAFRNSSEFLAASRRRAHQKILIGQAGALMLALFWRYDQTVA
jgi:hypothetical protein